MNYRNKGGQFRVKSDLKKIYGMRDDIFTELYEFIDLPETFVNANKSAFKKPLTAEIKRKERLYHLLI